MADALLDARSAYLVVGLLYLAMALGAWSILHRLHDARSTALWCGSASLIGGGCLLVGLRGTVPDAASLVGGHLLVFGGFAGRVAALRRELELPHDLRRVAAIALAVGVAHALGWGAGEAARLAAAAVLVALGAAAIAFYAWRLGRTRRLRSAWLLAGCYAILAALLLLQVALAASPLAAEAAASRRVALFAAGLLTGLYGNLGFIGIALEQLHGRTLAHERELAAQQAQREAVQRTSAALQSLIDERSEMMRVLAHEVRRPLQAAGGVLQAARESLDRRVGTDRSTAATRVVRAHEVLRGILGRIDGTLVAAEVLAGQARPQRVQVDVHRLLHEALAGLAAEQRCRVELHGGDLAAARARLDWRLALAALRNLLEHALAPPSGAPVQLRARHEAGLLLIDVQWRREAAHGRPMHDSGLALAVARTVASLHGGELHTRSSAGGVQARLRLPADSH